MQSRLLYKKNGRRILKYKFWYCLCFIIKASNRKAVQNMTQQFKYVGGHIEVYSETGEFLFSADTMREAWEELSA